MAARAGSTDRTLAATLEDLELEVQRLQGLVAEADEQLRQVLP